ncbi:helix-turn-helix domain-containing protein [Bacillus luti]|uniref:helix-turn-helix domain-containing protein n=1 Tax=Bacillus luti TaxID=2026191 RepID=UPI003D092D9A
MTEYLSVKEFANRLGKSEETIKRWIRSGKIVNARKESDKKGWQIPECCLHPNNQSEQQMLPMKEPVVVTPPSVSDVEQIISLAYQIAFLCEPSESILHRLKVCGLERAMEIILTMRQSPNTIRNPEGFISKAVVLGWGPNTLLRRQDKKKTEQSEPSHSPLNLYNWLEN